MVTLTSTAFEHNTEVPEKYTCQGADVSPPLTISDVPPGTDTFALIMEDPDAPDPEAPTMTWDHWIVFNIPPNSLEILEGKISGIVGVNSWGHTSYGGPCPPIGTHRYFFKLYALDRVLDLDEKTTKKDLLEAMEGNILGETELIGLYKKH